MTDSYLHPERFARSREPHEQALRVIPGGVNSTARAAFSGWTPHPIFAKGGKGSKLTDVDGNVYIDYLLGLGPVIFGHRPEHITEAVTEKIRSVGTVFAMATEPEIGLAQQIIDMVPSIDTVRIVNTGTEAVLYALRLARAFTGRTKIIRFEGQYHGFSDGIYWSKHPDLDKAGPDEHPIALPQGPGFRRKWASR